MDFSVGIEKYPLNVFAFLEENGEQSIQNFASIHHLSNRPLKKSNFNLVKCGQ